MQRRFALMALASAAGLSACGFRLRQPPEFAFSRLYCSAADTSSLWIELRRNLLSTGKLEVLTRADEQSKAEVILDLLEEHREKSVVALNTAGQVKELQLRFRVKFRLRLPDGTEIIAPTEIVQQRDMSFSETLALAKDAEEQLLYRDMQADIVRQLMRRLAAPKQI